MRWIALTVGFLSASVALPQGLSPKEALARMKTPDDVRVRLVASEPLIRQPLSLSFDDRGRLWVLQYLQYPNPAGLKAVEVDRYLRTKWDRKPEPPPKGPKGADRITILTDEDGDGVMDHAKDFLSNLNLATGFIHGCGGVFVLQSPYLLFYADKNCDDVPDGDPEVLLDGFGMEDSHAYANSLTWGPDGWLYGAQGSTVTANIRGITFQQGVWRYHPKTKKFELFAEGGGNTWGLDFNRWGDCIAGTNLGGAAMLHHVQGAYYVKGFEKHGALQNPFAYGYFEHAPYKDFRGGHVTCGGIVYQGGALPERYHGRYIAANLLSNAIHWHEFEPNGSTFKNRFGGELLVANDTWFRPIDCETGPDGAVYIADWTDKRANHVDPRDDWDKTNGRIYAIEAKNAKKVEPFDLEKKTSNDLSRLLFDSNDWFARKARQILAERQDLLVLQDLVSSMGNRAFEPYPMKALFGINAVGEVTSNWLASDLNHRDESVRKWAIRLIGDDPTRHAAALSELIRLASTDESLHVRLQLACTAKRLPCDHAVRIIETLCRRSEDATDPFIPLLLWWAVECKCDSDRDKVLAWLKNGDLWSRPIFRDTLLPRLARRFAAKGSTEECRGLAEILTSADSHGLFQQTVAAAESDLPLLDRPPTALKSALGLIRSKPFLAGLQFAMKFRLDWAIQAANERIIDPNSAFEDRKALLESLCRCVPEAGARQATAILQSDRMASLHQAALAAVRSYTDPKVGEVVLELGVRSQGVRQKCVELLASRPTFAAMMVNAVEKTRLKPTDVPSADLQRIAAFKDAALNARIEKIWGKVAPPTPAEKVAQIHGHKVSVRLAKGDPAKGKSLFKQHCANCHILFGEGAKIGPELTGADRKNLDFLMISLVDPSAVIRKEFMSHSVVTTDGRTLNGLVAESSPTTLTLIDSKAQRISIPQADVEAMKPSSVSVMPERLLDTMNAEQVRDLMAYLQSNPK
jgi:putative membrane-bound dehydrogenase-like protein